MKLQADSVLFREGLTLKRKSLKMEEDFLKNDPPESTHIGSFGKFFGNISNYLVIYLSIFSHIQEKR